MWFVAGVRIKYKDKLFDSQDFNPFNKQLSRIWDLFSIKGRRVVEGK